MSNKKGRGAKRKPAKRKKEGNLKTYQSRAPFSFDCVSGRLVFGQLYSLLPEAGEPWTMRDALQGRYNVEMVRVDSLDVAYIVWHESVECVEDLVSMVCPAEVVKEESAYALLSLGRYWFDHLSAEDVEKLLTSELELPDDPQDIPFLQGFSIWDETLSAKICSYAALGKGSKVEGKDILFCDENDQTLGCYLGHDVDDYQYGWVFTTRDGKLCGFLYNFDYSNIVSDINPETSVLRIGDGLEVQLMDPDDDLWDEGFLDNDDEEPLTMDCESCIQLLLIHRFRPDCIVAKLPIDVVRLICGMIFELDDVNDEEVASLLVPEIELENE